MKEFEITLPVGPAPDRERLRLEACRALGLPKTAQPSVVVLKRSLDARKDPVYRYRVAAYAPGEELPSSDFPPLKDVHDAPSVIVVGAGPAGLFAAIKLVELGLRPVILERGQDVHRRKADVASLSRDGVLNPDSNYCYGEGGAGTFSDGKLFTRSSKRGDIYEVLGRLVEFGASPDIMIDAHPHIGSDKLPAVVEHIREAIIEHGGSYHFGTKVTSVSRLDSGAIAVEAVRDGESLVFESPAVILATGHSARDVYEMLSARGCELQAKGFALGVRVEHPRRIIDNARYHGKQIPGLGAAEYSFVEQVLDRGVFSFCMCPGGVLVPSSTEDGTVVLNGMSNSARNSKWSNAGVVVQIEPEDVPEKYRPAGAFALMDFQHDVEKAMYDYVQGKGAKHPFAAPGQRMKDFCRGIESVGLPASSYFPGVVSAPLHELLPDFIYKRMRLVFPTVDRKIHGYYTNDALLLGVESRTSSPIRIVRDSETLESPSMSGLYPCGEGAGYSGGIVSSAIDGIRCALAAASRF